MSAPLFSKRHYEWLARWAGENLSPAQIGTLAVALKGTNPAYQLDKFTCCADDIAAKCAWPTGVRA